jgi:hypothetical protein
MQIIDLQALKAMEKFLEHYYLKNKSDDIGLILSDISSGLFTDTVTADPAAWEDWQDAVLLVLKNKSTNILTEEQAFNAMVYFVREFGNRISSTDIKLLLNEILINDSLNVPKKNVWVFWKECLKETLKKNNFT